MQLQTQVINRHRDTNISPKFLHINNDDLRSVTESRLRAYDPAIELIAAPRIDKLLLTVNLSALSFNLPEAGGQFTPRLWILNNNKGGQAMQVGIGLFRYLCMNGLYFGIASLTRKLYHVDGPSAHNFLDRLPTLLNDAVNDVLSGELQSIMTDAIEYSVAQPVNVVGNLPVPVRVKDRVIQQIIMGNHRVEDRPNTAWGIYNMVNEAYRYIGRSPMRKALTDMTLLSDIQALAA